ncbi:MAG: transposase [Ruminococcaceae bacterium]|nr:transposase [Oscillospiraceae bacterium]
MPVKPERKQPRLSEYDYGTAGCTFVTLCTQDRANLFQMEPPANDSMGNRVLRRGLRLLEEHFPGVTVDKYVIMPDHLHLMITIGETQTRQAIPDVMQYFKTITTNDYIRGVKAGFLPPFHGKLWQRSYYDHVIRNQQDYDETWQYIENNPTKWMMLHNITP